MEFYLNALYAGLNQHRNEKGVKSTRYKIDRPNVVNSPSFIISVIPPSTLRTSTHAWTATF